MHETLKTMRKKTSDHWNAVFEGETPLEAATLSLGVPALDDALNWLCEGARAVLDFGCGNGRALCACGMRGVARLTGIDLSARGIEQARRLAALSGFSRAAFVEGGVEALDALPAASYDGAVLFNILDNLAPDDALRALDGVCRVLSPGGRALVKLNPHLSALQIREWNIRVLVGDLLDDGLLLWNLPTEKWDALLASRFALQSHAEVYYPQFGQTNRLYRVTGR